MNKTSQQLTNEKLVSSAPEVNHHQRVDEKGLIKSVGLLMRLVSRFGLAAGFKIFAQVKLEKMDHVRVPGVLHPISLRKASTDKYAFFQTFLYKEYELDYVAAPAVIIDGGANIGMFSVLMKNQFPHAQVISIEPDAENFRQLKLNTSNYQNVFLENMGLWNKDTNLHVYDKYELGNWGMVVEESPSGNIKGGSINMLMRKYNLKQIDILKLDIESSEKVIFSSNYEYWLSRTRMIIIELHDSLQAGCAQQFFEVIQKVFNKYSFAVKGENVIITNLSWQPDEAPQS
ncbi:FkbM family methyltransferase [Aridibaculum aurantiacum]|uniref:FkbM family methyltransferase n=1 Tax=Aridibaculum aurantiacum TaxID=2810307 RepID=UPI001A9589E0|nr:FkbM family methyltransferase [Aridibaculum aurantiacum]